MLFWINGIQGFRFEFNKKDLTVDIFAITYEDDNELIDTIDVCSIETMEQDVKDYMFKYVI